MECIRTSGPNTQLDARWGGGIVRYSVNDGVGLFDSSHSGAINRER